MKTTRAVELFLPTLALVLVRFRKWGEVLTLPRPDPRQVVTTAYWHFARGMV